MHDRYLARVDSKHFNIMDLIEYIDENQIKYVHFEVDDIVKSELIESILLRISIGVFYFDMRNNCVLETFDGKKRISVIHDFVNDKFKLNGMKFFPELNELSYSEIQRGIQRRIDEYMINYELIDIEVPEDMKEIIKQRMITKL
jgi:hypothetical protein